MTQNELGKTHELSDIDVVEVSLVGKPSNKRKFLLYKSEELPDGSRVEEMREDAETHFEGVQAEPINKQGVEKVYDNTDVTTTNRRMNDGAKQEWIDICETCGGAGIIPAQLCERCNGKGYTGNATRVVCQECFGMKRIPQAQCPKCKGKGYLTSAILGRHDKRILDYIGVRANFMQVSKSMSQFGALDAVMSEPWANKLLQIYNSGQATVDAVQKAESGKGANLASSELMRMVDSEIEKGISRVAAIDRVARAHPELYDESCGGA